MYNKYRGELHMKPRVFVSSTFYDLKYIREDLANFIKAHDFEPIMFEDGDIGYTPGKELDDSCYESMRNSDMTILIIGGQYGSAATGENDKISQFISITRNEFRTAIRNSIPVFCFIDKAVSSEFEIYKLNRENLEKNNDSILFKATKNINIFRFIEEIYMIGKIPINTFERSEDIKDFLGKQWADMFKKYLINLKDKNTINDMQETLSEMKSIVNEMNIMIKGVGRKVISNNEEYNSLLEEQSKIRVSELCDEITKNIEIDTMTKALNDNQKNKCITTLLDALINVNKFVDNFVFSSSKELQDLVQEAAMKLKKELRLSGMRLSRVSNELIMANRKIIELDNNTKDYDLLISYLSKTKNFNQIFSLRYS